SAIGFSFEYLPKLKSIKSTTNKAVTLVHFLARALKMECPDDYDLHAQLASSEAAAKLEVKVLRQRLDELRGALEQLDQLAEGATNGTDTSVEAASADGLHNGADAMDTRFKVRMLQFREDAVTKMTGAAHDLADTE
ncbi:formin-like protein, partial [Haematococcus lacustris]